MKEWRDDRKADVTMLFIEDNCDDIFLISKALSKTKVAAGIFLRTLAEVQAYLDGAGEFCDRNRFPVPGIIVTDYHLSGNSAKDVINCVRGSEQFKNIPIVVLSAFVPPGEVDAVLVAGAKAYLEKPAQFSEVCAVLERTLQLARN